MIGLILEAPKPADPNYIVWRQEQLEQIAQEAREADTAAHIDYLVARLGSLPLYQKHTEQFPKHYAYERGIIDFLAEKKKEIIDSIISTK